MKQLNKHDFEIIEPIQLRFSIIEIVDKYLPSMRLAINLEASFNQADLISISNQVWVECEKWSLFEAEFTKRVSAKLDDMNQEFILETSFEELNNIYMDITWTPSRFKKVKGKFETRIILDEDGYSKILNELKNFPKWW
jgi:hypothetical protein